jgi:hypothetical protein
MQDSFRVLCGRTLTSQNFDGPGRILCGYARKSLETVRDISHMILLDENVSVYPFHHTHLTWTNCVKNIIYTLHNTIVVFSTAISKAFITLIVCSVFLHLVVRLPYKAENGLKKLTISCLLFALSSSSLLCSKGYELWKLPPHMLIVSTTRPCR